MNNVELINDIVISEFKKIHSRDFLDGSFHYINFENRKWKNVKFYSKKKVLLQPKGLSKCFLEGA